jgi:hypothetical protein
MCNILIDHIKKGNTQVLMDVRRVAKYAADEVPTDPKEVRSSFLNI